MKSGGDAPANVKTRGGKSLPVASVHPEPGHRSRGDAIRTSGAAGEFAKGPVLGFE